MAKSGKLPLVWPDLNFSADPKPLNMVFGGSRRPKPFTAETSAPPQKTTNAFEPPTLNHDGLHTIGPSRVVRRALGLDQPHAPTLAAFQSLAALGTVPPKPSEISSAALAAAGLHPETFLAAYTAALSREENILFPVSGVDDSVRNVSARTGSLCAQIMQHLYVQPLAPLPCMPVSTEFDIK